MGWLSNDGDIAETHADLALKHADLAQK